MQPVGKVCHISTELACERALLMARRMKRWHWIRLIMAQGPVVASVRVVLFALSVRMDDAGEAFPSQKTIAADTALSERTVRDAILEARRAGWLAVVECTRSGSTWRRHHYVACLPDRLDLSRVSLGKGVDAEQIANICAAQLGDVDDPLHGKPRSEGGRGARSRRAKGAAAMKGSYARKRSESAATAAADAATTTEDSATSSTKVRQPSPTKFPSKFPIKSPQEGSVQERTPSNELIATNWPLQHGPQSEPAVSNPIDSSRPAIPSEVLQGNGVQEGDAQTVAQFDPGIARQKVEKVCRELPEFSAGDIAKVTHLPIETVQAILRCAP